MATSRLLVQYAIALNNVSVTLLQHGQSDEAIEAMKHSCNIMKVVLSTQDDSSHVSDEIVQSIKSEYDIAIQRLAQSNPGGILDNEIMHVNVVVFNGHEVMNGKECVSTSSTSGIINLIRFECLGFDSVNLELFVSIQLYNWALMHLYKAKLCDISSNASISGTRYRTIAMRLIRHSYFVVCRRDEVNAFVTEIHHVEALILQSMIFILQENSADDECEIYRSRLCNIMKLLVATERVTNLFLAQKSAPAA